MTAVNEYLVQFGRSAFVGRFTYEGDESFPRGKEVVVKSIRGEEVGTVLCKTVDRFASTIGEPAGNLIRSLNANDHVSLENANQRALTILSTAEQQLGSLPVSFVDAESTLDGATVVLHVIAYSECDLKPLLTWLSAEFHTVVTLHDLSLQKALPDAADAVEAGCGKPNCGSESGGGCGSNGGCSTGSCSKGKIKSADELTEYFADLRQKMEHVASNRVSLR